MNESVWAAYQNRLKKLEETKQTIIELYGSYDAYTVRRVLFDGLISSSERMELSRDCPYN